jgi:hypothetical protein
MSSSRRHLVAILAWDYAGGAQHRLVQLGKGHHLLGHDIAHRPSRFHGSRTVGTGMVVVVAAAAAPTTMVLVLGRYRTQLEHPAELLAAAATTPVVAVHLQMALAPHAEESRHRKPVASSRSRAPPLR